MKRSKLYLFLFLGCFCSFPYIVKAEYKNESEVGIVLTSGNTQTRSYRLRHRSEVSFHRNTLRLDSNYLHAKQKGVLSAESWFLGLRYERHISPKFSAFLGQSVEGDRFAGVLQRYNTDLGGKYFFFKRDKDFLWLAELGYRLTHEHDTSNVRKRFQKARVYTEAEKFWSEAVSARLWIEYIPNFTLSEAWIINTETSVASKLSTVLSVKTSYLVKYHNRPSTAAALNRDTIFMTSLVASF